MTQGSTDAVLQLVAENGIRTEDIEEVVVNSGALDNPDPDQGHRAKFSLQYTTAAAIVDRQIVVESFHDERVNSADVREFMKRVRLVRGGNPRHPPVTLRLKDGRELTREVWPHGDVHDRFSDDEVFAKYRDASQRVLSTEACEMSLELIMNLENQPTIDALIEVIGRSPASVPA
jgi:2-methylcitrate dehydratase PrpD